MPKRWVEPRIPTDELNEMVVEYAERRAWLMRDVPDRERSMVFFLLVWGAPLEWKKHMPAEVYGHGRDQLGRACNGYPMFTKLRALYLQDLEVFLSKVKALREAQEKVLAA